MLLRDSPKGVFRRGTKLYYRHFLPIDAQRLLNRREVWRSLGTDSFSVAKRRLPAVIAQIEAEIERARAVAGQVFDEALLTASTVSTSKVTMSAAQPAQPSLPETTLTLAEAYERYITDPTRAWSNSTREAYETSRRLAVSVFGDDLPLASISRSHCRDLLEVLRFLPSNASKRFPKLTPREAAERRRKDASIQTISAANANSLMANLSSFLNWAVNEELLVRNPARGLRLPDPVRKRDKRLPFSPEQLKAIFNAPLYRGCLDGSRGYNTVGTERPRNARFWVPLIALFTGARLSEIITLDATDVREVESIPCIVISPQSLVGSKDKHLKTIQSERLIPLHRTLIECGLISFSAEVRAAGNTKLFNDGGCDPVSFSKWFTQFQRACGAQRPRTSFHSFRHNFRDELRAARIERDVAMLLGGWTTGSARNSVSDNYGSGYRVAILQEAISKLRFADVNVAHLTLRAR